MNEVEKALLAKWESAKEILAEAKAVEMELREIVSKTFFPKPEEGTQYIDLENGYRLKLAHKLNYNLDKDNDKINAALDKVAACGNEGQFIAERLINWKPSLSISEYREISGPIKDAVDAVLTISPGAPTLEIVEPKGKKK
jgi:hypothetical protein